MLLSKRPGVLLKRSRCGRPNSLLLGILILAALAIAALYHHSPTTFAPLRGSSVHRYGGGSSTQPGRLQQKQRLQWRGWEQIEHIFFFGDSWTSNGFEIKDRQPDELNPIGNPDFPGKCSSNGPNWVSFMAGSYNKTFVRAYDIAHGAATVDRHVVPPLFTQTSTLREQVGELFSSVYLQQKHLVPWQPNNAVFAIWSGIVDIALSVREKNSTELVPRILASYSTAIDQLYQFGARNFLLVNIPPMHRAPGNEDPPLAKIFVHNFNEQLETVRRNFTDTYEDANVMLFSVNGLFEEILSDPKEFPQITSMVRNFTDWCGGYNDLFGPTTPEWDTFYPECGVAVNQYFWLNPLHPGYAVHNATAYAIMRDCGHEPAGKFCI